MAIHGGPGTVDRWAEENGADIEAWITIALDAFAHDTSLRVPRTQAARQDGFAPWLAVYRDQLGAHLASTLSLDVPGLARRLADPARIKRVFDSAVWPRIEPQVRAYAVRGLAAAWASRNLGDAVVLHSPEAVGAGWRIPLSVRSAPEVVGYILLDRDGNVLPGTTTREQLLRAIGGTTGPGGTTTAGQQ